MTVLIRLDLKYFYMMDDGEYYLLSRYHPKNWRISSLSRNALESLDFLTIPEWV